MTLQEHSHITIIQTAFLGDVALALYLAQEIHNLHPQGTLRFVTTPLAAPLVQCAEAVQEVLVFDKRQEHHGWKGIRTLANELHIRRTDCVIGLQRSVRTSMLAAMSGAKHRLGFSNAALSVLYTKRKEWQLHLHESQRNRQLLSCFSDYVVPHDGVLPSVQLRLPEYSLPFAGKKIVALAPGSVWATKRWSVEGYTQTALLLRNKGYDVVLLGAREDNTLCSAIAKESGALSLAGQTTLPQTLRVLQQCTALISNDSAPVHLAGLVGCRTIALFGSTLPEFGFAPLGTNDLALENPNLTCRPCGIHGHKRCPLGTMECMNSIAPDVVVQHL